MNLDQLVKGAKNGDKKATYEILESLKPFIIKTSKTIFIKGYEMEDLIQIGYVTLMKAITNFKCENNNKFLTYAVSAIKNNFYYEIRKRCRQNSEISLNIKNEEDLETIDLLCSNENIEDNLICKEMNKELELALRKLTDEERNLIIYIYFSGNKMKKYAEEHNINYIALAKKKSRILKKLKKLIES